MTDLQRLTNMVLGKPVDRGIFAGEGLLAETPRRWRKEGMPEDYDFGYDFAYHEGLGINMGHLPAWQEEVIEDEGPTELVRDANGIVKRRWKDQSGMPEFISFPVSGRESWREVRQRLEADAPGRFPDNWPERVERLKLTDKMITFGGTYVGGFFGYLRELCGDDIYYLFYDDPALVEEMLEFQADRLIALIEPIAQAGVRIDEFFVWEDMCYKNGPLIGPDRFRELIVGPMTRTVDAAKRCGAKIVNVDSDGNIEKLIPLWLEAGVNMLHPFEVAAGMDVVAIKRQYGDRLVVRGGIDKRELAKDFAAIDREMQRVQPAYDLGGYIPTVDHAVPHDVSWDNFRHYLDKKAQMVGL